jgi:paraquat-inducible protein B
MPEETRPHPVPESNIVPKNRTKLSLVWIIPILAAVVGAWVAVVRIMSQGPTITIMLHTAEGLEEGKTKVHYNGVDIGTVTNVEATVQMAPKTEEFLVQDTNFWVVSPRISGASVTGLGTLIKGEYIGVEIGHSTKSRRKFVALDTPPVVTKDVPGRYFVLKSDDLGSVDTGTPIFYRHLRVGEVTAYELDKDGTFTIKVFVKAPYDTYVTSNTRFWEASGFDMSLSAAGLTLDTQSVVSILVGGVAFGTPPYEPTLAAAEEQTVFQMYGSQKDAFAKPPFAPQRFVVLFDASVRGLDPGAPVAFRGVPVGEVAAISAQLDMNTAVFTVPVTLNLDAQRLGVKVIGADSGTDIVATRRKLLDALVARGVRARLESGNLLTGARYVALDFFPDAPPASIDWSQTPPRFPTIPGQFQTVEADVTSLLKKIDQVPFKAIGDDLQKTIGELNKTLVSARGAVNSANALIEPNSMFSQQLSSTMEEMNRAARSMRVLTDYLERHPEALVRGKSEGAK